MTDIIADDPVVGREVVDALVVAKSVVTRSVVAKFVVSRSTGIFSKFFSLSKQSCRVSYL